MTKKKLNNLLNFIIFVFPLLLLLCSALMKLNDGTSDLWMFNQFVENLINQFSQIPLFNSICEIVMICFDMSLTQISNCPIVLILVGFMVYLIFATICIIIKDLLLLIVNICNKYIFLDD